MSRDLAVLSSSFFLIFMGAGAFQQYLIRFLKDVTGRTGPECSWVLATVYLSFLVWRIFAAYTIRWLGDQRSIFLGQVTYTLFLVFAIFTRDYWLLLGAAALWGWGASAMWIASSTQILDASARTRYGSASGVFYAATHLGQWLGVILMGWLFTHGGWGPLLGVALGVSVLGNLVALAVPRKYVAREEPRISKVFGVLRSPESKALALILFVSSAGFGLILSVFGTLLSTEHLVWITSGFYGGRLVSSWYAGGISDRLGRRAVLVAGFALSAVGMLIGLLSGSSAALFAAALTLGVQSGTVPVAAMAMVGDFTDPSRRHLAFGAIYVWRDLGVALTILGSQQLVSRVGQGVCFGAFAVLFAVCALVAMGLRQRKESAAS